MMYLKSPWELQQELELEQALYVSSSRGFFSALCCVLFIIKAPAWETQELPPTQHMGFSMFIPIRLWYPPFPSETTPTPTDPVILVGLTSSSGSLDVGHGWSEVASPSHGSLWPQ